jgi:uncharacterized membrane protein YtjA (UPF0391 family)
MSARLALVRSPLTIVAAGRQCAGLSLLPLLPRRGRQRLDGLATENRDRGAPARRLQAFPRDSEPNEEKRPMLHYAIVFFVIALIAAFFGFSGIAVGAAGIAKLLFVAFLVVAVISLFVGRRRI